MSKWEYSQSEEFLQGPPKGDHLFRLGWNTKNETWNKRKTLHNPKMWAFFFTQRNVQICLRSHYKNCVNIFGSCNKYVSRATYLVTVHYWMSHFSTQIQSNVFKTQLRVSHYFLSHMTQFFYTILDCKDCRIFHVCKEYGVSLTYRLKDF